VIDIGPGAGEDGGLVVAAGTPIDVSSSNKSATAPYLEKFLKSNALRADVPVLGLVVD
jgi:excinuclease ABC subunit A